MAAKTKTTTPKTKTAKSASVAKATKATGATTEKKSIRNKGARFLGWQLTPYSQAAYGPSTHSGRRSQKFELLASTGSVTKTESRFYLVDASEAPVGRVVTTIATLLMGKNRATFTYGAGCGDSVIVINADKAYFSANKADKKMYYSHSLYMGGLKNTTAGQMLKDKPERVIWLAAQGMMPKNKLSRYQLSLLKIYKGKEHPHSAQKPVPVSLKQPLKKLAS